jgi:pimeloyl-ACP methyl ester carboxylesterase
VRLDLAGFGERSGAPGPFTFDRFAADLSAVVDAVDKPFVLVGHSMAAPIVELVAERRPDRALGLLLVSPIPIAGTRLPDEAFESFRSLGELGAADYRAFRRQVAPLAPVAELERLVVVAASFRAEVAIPPATESFMARRAHAHIETVDASHVSYISHPGVTTDLILKAARSIS